MFRNLFVVAAVMIAASLSPLPVLGLATWLGVDPATLQGANFQVTPVHLGLMLGFAAVMSAIPLAAFRWGEGRPAMDLGMRAPFAFRNLLLGHLFGFAMALSTVALELALSRGVTITWAVPPDFGWGSLGLTYLFFVGVLLTINSLKEELVYRAYPMEVLGGESPWRAILISSVLFSATHLILEPPTLRGFLFRLLFGILACQVYAVSRSLWAAVGFHNAWNWVASSLSGNWKLGGLWALAVDDEPAVVAWVTPAVLVAGVVLVLIVARRGARRPAPNAVLAP